MKYNPDQHRRRSIRLKGYDYSASGAYFITICTHQRQCLFGAIATDEMVLNELGYIVEICWQNIPNHFPHVHLDQFVVMPNHLHGILMIINDIRRGEAVAPRELSFSNNLNATASPLPACGTQPKSIGAIVQNFKSISTRKINQGTRSTGRTVWQRNYYEHIIRNPTSLHQIQQYIHNNPLLWQTDSLHPGNSSF